MAETMMTVENLSLRSGSEAISAKIQSGEIVGLAGLDGHGQDTFLTCLAGIEPSNGAVTVGREAVSSFRTAARNGIVYVPRDRRSTGIFPGLSILDNFAISTVGRDRRGPLLSFKARRERYDYWKERLKIVAPSPEAPITALSGGNQQKVLLARALARDPKVLLLNDPTRGVDVATRHVLYDLFRELAKEGIALVIVSTEIEEVLLLCDRVMVFRDHALSAEMAGDDMQTDTVIAAMFGREA